MSLRLAWFRTGFQGIGTFGLPELFLRVLDGDILKSWIADNLTAGNAAIWIAGDLPDDLLVALPAGPRRSLPEVRFIPYLETPTIVGDDVPGVGASFYVERNPAVITALRALDRHLRRALRVDRGLGYDVGSDYVPLDPTHAIASVWATCLPNSVRDVERVVLETIDDLANRGPDEDELTTFHQRALREAADPASIPGRLDAQVRDHLLGGRTEPLAELLDQQWRLEPDHVAAAFRRARESMILLVPSTGTMPQREFKPYPGATPGSLGNGHFFDLQAKQPRKLPFGRVAAPRLVVANGGVALEDARGRRFLAVRWEDCLAVIREPNARFVVGRDGTFLKVFADEWKDGNGAIKQIEKLAPRGVFVPMQS